MAADTQKSCAFMEAARMVPMPEVIHPIECSFPSYLLSDVTEALKATAKQWANSPRFLPFRQLEHELAQQKEELVLLPSNTLERIRSLEQQSEQLTQHLEQLCGMNRSLRQHVASASKAIEHQRWQAAETLRANGNDICSLQAHIEQLIKRQLHLQKEEQSLQQRLTQLETLIEPLYH